MNEMKFPRLFSPIKIRGLELKNRVVMPAMGTFFSDPGGYINDRLIDYFCARARGGCGLITPEATSVHAPSAPNNFINISEDKFVPGLTKLTKAVHEAGAKICVQLWQGGLTPIFFDPNTMPIVPSDLTIHSIFGNMLPQPMQIPATSRDIIHDVIKSFGAAAARAVEAGFDTMEMHFAHGYSPNEFLSPAFNHRTDEYGGSFENRSRFLLECVRAVRQNIPEDMPLFMRVNSQDDYLEGGLTLEDVIAFCNLAKAEGVDVVHVSRGNPITLGMKFEVPPIDLPRGYNVENIAKIKNGTGLVTIAVGRINSADQAEDILAEDKADLIALGRGQLADPEFCNKACSGQDEDIVRCVGCGGGCGGSPMTCSRNPRVGRESEFAVTKTAQAKKVAIVGGGLGGMEAAIQLNARGHVPVLFEASEKLGGQFLLAGAAPGKDEMREAAIARANQTARAGIDIRLSTPATAEALDMVQPDVVVVAVGAKPIILRVPGVDLSHVLSFTDVLSGKAKAHGRIAVIGGGLVGLEVADYVIERFPGSTVTIIEMLDVVGKDLPSSRRMCVMERLEHANVEMLTEAKCKEITKTAVVVNTANGEKSIACDHVVIAVGSAPNQYKDIDDYCSERNIPCYIIGDAKQVRKVVNAVEEAWSTAMVI